MDISGHIASLLFEHDCVIIPGFGGFVCSYKPADIHPVQNTIAPPAKAITFNKNLLTNDGLLINYIATDKEISFVAALTLVNEWVNASKSLLNNGETIHLHQVGKLYLNNEKNIQFEADGTVNYLKASYGLPTITVIPVIRGKEVSINRHEEPAEEIAAANKATLSRGMWLRVAAIALLFVALAGLTQLVWQGVAIKPLQLNEAGVLGFMNNIFRTPEADIKPLAETEQPAGVQETQTPVAEETPASTNIETTASPQAVETPAPVAVATATNNTEPASGFYIIIGAFREEKNVALAKERLQQAHPGAAILTESKNGLIKVGYFAGSDAATARQQLNAAKAEDQSYWLHRK